MALLSRGVLRPATDFASPEAALFLAQLDMLTEQLFTDLEGVAKAELEWQPQPGANTIGMLLAHLAIVDVYWTQIGLRVEAPHDCARILGITMDDDGMPIPKGGAPPANLAGKDLAYYRELIGRGREYLRETARGLADSQLTIELERTRPNGARQTFDRRWALFHLVEHFAGHYGQILLLRHLYRER
jgi:uncharacterized damage-inducible protein DinB